MTKKKTQRRKRRSFSDEDKAKHIAEMARLGMTPNAYAEHADLTKSALNRWLQRARLENAVAAKASARAGHAAPNGRANGASPPLEPSPLAPPPPPPSEPLLDGHPTLYMLRAALDRLERDRAALQTTLGILEREIRAESARKLAR